jgi:septum formation protein
LLYLASRSPRRQKLLQQLGVEFDTVEIDIEEVWDGRESAVEYVSRLALSKALAAQKIVDKNWPILASDTEVVVDGRILGKPNNNDHAVSMLMALSGRSHEVLSAVTLLHKTQQTLVSKNRLSFREISEQECFQYVEFGESDDKAGAYAIQGRAAAFISSLEGSYSSVMGLPLTETTKLLELI